MTDDPGRVMITLKDVYDLVLEVKETVTSYASLPSRVEDHEKRLRVLETPTKTPLATWILVIVGAVGGSVGLMTLLINLMRWIPDIP